MRESLAALLFLLGGLGIRGLLRMPRRRWTYEVASSILLAFAALGVVGPLAALAGLDVPVAAAIFLGVVAAVGGLPRAAAILPRPWKEERWTALLIVGMLILVATAMARLPVGGGDEVFVWGYKAGLIDASRTIDPRGWSQGVDRGGSYPLGLPVAASVVATLTGWFDGFAGRVVAFCAYLACAGALAELTALWARGALRLVLLFGVLASPIVASMAPLFMGDIPMLAAVALAVVALATEPVTWRLLVPIVALVPLKLDGAPVAAALLLFVGFRCPAGTRLRFAAAAIAAMAIVVLPWAFVHARFGFNPITTEKWGTARRFGEISGSLSSPVTLARQLFVASLQVVLTAVPFASPVAHRVPWEAPGAFGALLPAIFLLAMARPAVARPWTIPQALGLAALLFVGQIVPIAVAPNFEIQLGWVAERAAMHLIPALFLAAFAASEALASWLGDPTYSRGSETLPSPSRS